MEGPLDFRSEGTGPSPVPSLTDCPTGEKLPVVSESVFSSKIKANKACVTWDSQVAQNLPAMQETWLRSPGQEDPLETGMATHSNILAWRIPWTEEPGGLQSMGIAESDTTEWLTH